MKTCKKDCADIDCPNQGVSVEEVHETCFKPHPEQTEGLAEFEKAIRKFGIREACEYFNHPKDGGFANSLVARMTGEGEGR